MLFIEYPKCSTCKKAKKFLETPSKEELETWIKKYDIKLDKLYNTSGMKYRELNLKEKRQEMSEEEQLTLLSSDGMLIKRPILITEKAMLTGFREQEWKKVLEEERK